MDINFVKDISKTIRYYILRSTCIAKSGHLTSSLSAVELMTTLFFGQYFKYDIKNIHNPYNDTLIFSKGHASPLFYALWAAAGGLEYNELDTLRKFGSRLEGHPTLKFPYTFAPTGSLGQGLSIGIGITLANRMKNVTAPKTYILLGDGEMSEGSNWESLAIASHYKLNSICAIIDVNKFEQAGLTMLEHNVDMYKKRVEAFGWETVIIDGHSIIDISSAYEKFFKSKKPFCIIAKTIKGKGVKDVEGQSFHGKTLSIDMFNKIAQTDYAGVKLDLKGSLKKPERVFSDIKETQNLLNRISLLASDKSTGITNSKIKTPTRIDSPISTRKSYGLGITELGRKNQNVVVLDAGMNNSTFSEIFKEVFPERYFEMYIAEQNMMGAATGLARKGFIPFVSTFSAFCTRSFDQIRMAQYCDTHIIICGSHAGASFGLDGASQFGLEDIAMMRSVRDSTVLYPSDYYSTIKLVNEASKHKGICYIRTTRMDTPIIYGESDSFLIGGSKTLKTSRKDTITIIGAGITVHESLKAYEVLKQNQVNSRIVDLYSVKPIDFNMLKKAVDETKAILIVEDHYPDGGIYDAVCHALGNMPSIPIYQLAVTKQPISGQPHELLAYEEIDASAIVKKVQDILSNY